MSRHYYPYRRGQYDSFGSFGYPFIGGFLGGLLGNVFYPQQFYYPRYPVYPYPYPYYQPFQRYGGYY